MLLRELKPKDKFFAESDPKKKYLFEKMGDCEFNSGHGTSTCKCYVWDKGLVVNKSCNLKVIVDNDAPTGLIPKMQRELL